MSRLETLHLGQASSDEDVELESADSAEDFFEHGQPRLGNGRIVLSGLGVLVLGVCVVATVHQQFTAHGTAAALTRAHVQPLHAGRIPGVIMEQAAIPPEWNPKADNIIKHWPVPRSEAIAALQKFNGGELAALNYIEEQHSGCNGCALHDNGTAGAPAVTLVPTVSPVAVGGSTPPPVVETTQLFTFPTSTVAPSTSASACDFNSPPPAPPAGTPPQCMIPQSQALNDDSVKQVCATKGDWEAAAQKVKEGGRCKIDPTTKMMVCENNAECSGGSELKKSVDFVNRTLTYNCPSRCQGALLIDCCNTCTAAQLNPAQFQVTAIACPGCDQQSQTLASQQANGDCSWTGSAFQCKTEGHCELGEAQQSCAKLNWQCDIVPCDKCTDDQLKAKCCADCVGRMCSGTYGRIVCKGCESPPTSGILGINIPNPFR